MSSCHDHGILVRCFLVHVFVGFKSLNHPALILQLPMHIYIYMDAHFSGKHRHRSRWLLDLMYMFFAHDHEVPLRMRPFSAVYTHVPNQEVMAIAI